MSRRSRLTWKSDETWADGTNPAMAAKTTGDDGIVVAASGDLIYACGSFPGVGGSRDRAIFCKAYRGPGAAGEWSAPPVEVTDNASDPHANADEINGAIANGLLMLIRKQADTNLTGAPFAIEYFTRPVR